MQQNIAPTERIVRALGAGGLLMASSLITTPSQWLAMIGAGLLATAVLGWCPIYQVVGVGPLPASAAGMTAGSSNAGGGRPLATQAPMRQLVPGMHVAPQISPSDIPAIAAAGVKLIINNRPENEVRAHQSGASIEAEARRHGLSYVYIPISHGPLRDADADAVREAIAKADGPVLTYCRSGTRTTAVWGLSQAGRRPFSEVSQAARAAGYEIGGLAPLFAAREKYASR